MLEQLTSTCEATGCNRELDADNFMLAYETEYGEQRAYECGCGAVTITVHQ